MLGGREALDWQRVCRKRRGPDGRDAGQTGQDLSGAVGEQLLELAVDERDVDAQRVEAIQVTGQAGGAQLSVWGWRETVCQRSVQNAAVASLRRPSARAFSERALGARPANAAAQARTARPAGVSSASARPWPAGAESPGASALSWSCSRWRNGVSASTSWRRWETAPSNASTPDGAADRPAP